MRTKPFAIGAVAFLLVTAAGCGCPRRSVVSSDRVPSSSESPAYTRTVGTPGVTTTRETPFSSESAEDAAARSKERPARPKDVVIHEHTVRKQAPPGNAEVPAAEKTGQEGCDAASPR